MTIKNSCSSHHRLGFRPGVSTYNVVQIYGTTSVIPVGVVLNKLLSSNQTDINDLERLIRRFSMVAIITREEEALLSKAGLRNSMPKDWDAEDIWARYKAVKLYELIESAPV